MAHITGGGITENLPRVLPKGTGAVVEMGTWPVLPIFEHLQQLGNIEPAEMMRTFNMGIGMLLVVLAQEVQAVQSRSSTASAKKRTWSAASSRATAKCSTRKRRCKIKLLL